MVLTAAEFSNLEHLQGTTGLRYYKGDLTQNRYIFNEFDFLLPLILAEKNQNKCCFLWIREILNTNLK